MTSYDIPVTSLTYAIKGQKILEQYGFIAYAGRDHANRSGCGYKLTIKGDIDKAVQILRQNGIFTSAER